MKFKITTVLFILTFMVVGSVSAQTNYYLKYQKVQLKMDGIIDTSQKTLTERALGNVTNAAPDFIVDGEALMTDAAARVLLSATADSIYATVNVTDASFSYDANPLASDRISFLFNVKKGNVDSLVNLTFPLLWEQLGAVTTPDGSRYLCVIDMAGGKYTYEIAIPINAIAKQTSRAVSELFFDLVFVDDDQQDGVNNPDIMMALNSDAAIDPFVDASKYGKLVLPTAPPVKVLSHYNPITEDLAKNFEPEYMFGPLHENRIHKISQQIIEGDTLLCDTLDKTGGGFFPWWGSMTGSSFCALRYQLDADQELDFMNNPYIEFKMKSDAPFIIVVNLLTAWGPITTGAYSYKDSIKVNEWKTVRLDYSKKFTILALKNYYKLDQIKGFMFNYEITPGDFEKNSSIKANILIDDIKMGNNVVFPTSLKNTYSESISVYPNPTTDFLNISTNEPINTVTIFDNLGKMVLTKSKLIGNQIDVSSLKAGIYYIKAKNQNITLNKSFIKN